MNIPRYWARASETAEDRDGKRFRANVCRGSHASIDDARRGAIEAARQLAQRLSLGERFEGRYGYADRGMREEVVDEIAQDGEVEAIITRNSYGSLVLNVSRVMFIDVDVPSSTVGGGLIRFASKLFGGSGPPSPAERVHNRITNWASGSPDYSGRIYRTFAGYRCLITNELLAPTGPRAQAVLDDLEADPLYRRLCEVQQCFRARLTPKFWRCGAARPPNRYPWDSPADEETYRRWQSEYDERCRPFATCKLVGQFGDGETLPLVERIVELHDRFTMANAVLPLA